MNGRPPKTHLSDKSAPLKAPKVFLLDVEGTVAPMSLVYEQLFPYARMHFERYLQGHSGEQGVMNDLAALAEESANETDATAPKFTNPDYWDEALPYLNWLMDRDRKSTALKSLQGRIWKIGFERDELKGTLFPDVPAALERWSSAGQVAIYSSGSVAAQMLLFRHSNFGDLTDRISGYFDTRTGPKTAASSYESIANAMDCRPQEIMFFSDAVRELDAARDAGCHTRIVMREGNAPVDDAHGHRKIKSFDLL
ncbi:acireductone synthase [Occallatibacter savannae]|uniref:acireductone synthase n=1 Tax=Occallatibacter savannae TaxID=1002691 RepID=UPI0013A5A897|nr:acireductone synthase [Occallatibacter savannae]